MKALFQRKDNVGAKKNNSYKKNTNSAKAVTQ